MDTESESEFAVATQVNMAYLARLHNRSQRTSIEPFKIFKRALQQVLEPADVRVLHEIDDNH